MRDPNVPSKISTAQLLKLFEIAWKESFNDKIIAQLNKDVGYYHNEEGFLQWDLTRRLPPQPVTAEMPVATVPAAAVPATGAVSAHAGAEPAASARAALLAPVTSHFGGRAAVQEAQAEGQIAQQRAREYLRNVVAVANIVRQNRAPPVTEQATQPAKRDAESRRHSRHGLIIGSDEHLAARSAQTAAAGVAAAKKVASERAFWEKHRVAVRGAEHALEEKCDDPELLGVGQLKAIIISRTGRTAKATNNKPPEKQMLEEAKAAMSSQPSSLIPPTPPRVLPEDSEDDNHSDDSVEASLARQ